MSHNIAPASDAWDCFHWVDAISKNGKPYQIGYPKTGVRSELARGPRAGRFEWCDVSWAMPSQGPKDGEGTGVPQLAEYKLSTSSSINYPYAVEVKVAKVPTGGSRYYFCDQGSDTYGLLVKREDVPHIVRYNSTSPSIAKGPMCSRNPGSVRLCGHATAWYAHKHFVLESSTIEPQIVSSISIPPASVTLSLVPDLQMLFATRGLGSSQMRWTQKAPPSAPASVHTCIFPARLRVGGTEPPRRPSPTRRRSAKRSAGARHRRSVPDVPHGTLICIRRRRPPAARVHSRVFAIQKDVQP
ncbi:hypothetical protein DFH07DRAFT_1061787, partial [Mycena maculata]